jgi:hypothetical protein
MTQLKLTKNKPANLDLGKKLKQEREKKELFI